jgi:WD40 repeat protein
VKQSLLLLPAAACACLADAGVVEQLRAEQQELRQRLWISEAEARIESDPGLALLLGLEADRLRPDARARVVLLRALLALHEVRTYTAPGGVLAAAFAGRQDTVVLTTSLDHGCLLWSGGNAPAPALAGTGAVIALHVAGHGKRAVTRTGNPWTGTRLWDLEHDRELTALVGADAVQFDAEGLWLAGAGVGGVASIWSAVDGSELAQVDLPPGRVKVLQIDPASGSVLIGQEGGAVLEWAWKEHALRRWPTSHRGSTLALAVTGTGECLSGGADGSVHVVDAARALRRTLRCPNPCVRFVAHDAASGNTLAWSSATAASARGTVRLWRADGEPLCTLADVAACTGFAGDAFACARGDVAEVFVAADGSPRATLRSHSGPLTSIAWDAEGVRLLTTAADGSAKLWNARPLGELWCAGTHETPTVLASSHDRRCFATGGDDRRVRLWNFADRSLRATVELPDEPRCCDFDASSVRLVVGGTAGDLHWIDVESGLLTRTATAHASQIDRVAFAPEGNRLASVDQAGRLLLWLEPSPTPMELESDLGACCALSFTPQGDRIVAVSRAGRIAVWQVGERRSQARWQGHAGPIRSVVVLPGSETIVTGGEDGALRAWGMDGSLRRHEQVHSGPVTALVPHGRDTVLSASVDGTVRRWEVGGTAAPTVVAAAGRPVTALAGADSGWAAFDAGAGIWLAAAPGAPPVRHLPGSPPFGAPCIDAQGDFAVGLALDGSVRFWPIDVAEHARRHVPRSMTADERAWFRLPDLSQTATR